ncbi:MAG: hypothetical protein U1F57_03865 [bacterium]
MKKHRLTLAAFCLSVFFSIPHLYSQSESPVLRLDLKDPKDFHLRNFRLASDAYKRKNPFDPVRIGLETLHISGSAQPTEAGFKELKEKTKAKTIVDIDLRQESHGFFDAYPVSWYATHDWANVGKTLSQVEKDENARLEAGLKEKDVTANLIKNVGDDEGELQEERIPFPLQVKTARTEQQIAESLGIQYRRLPITDHRSPTDADVDRFLEIVKALPQDAWVHFHCEAGIGRTTTFMALYDMLKNAKQVTYSDIVKRQWMIGGLDLLKMPSKEDYRYPYAVARTDLVRRFYDYAQGDQTLSWSEWLKAEKKKAGKPSEKKPQKELKNPTSKPESESKPS